MRRLLAYSTAFLAIMGVVLSASAQGALETATNGRKLSWDVVSVKPNKSLDPSSSMRMTPNGVDLRNATLQMLFLNGFEIKSESQIVGYPSWVNSEHFDIQAKMDAESAADYRNLKGEEGAVQWHSLVRQILEERFGMKYHREQRELPVYFLLVAKQGSKLHESAPKESTSSSWSPGKFASHHCRMSGLASSLSGAADRIVIDKTGLTGEYDVELTWAPDGQPDAGPSIFTAVQEELGLKLEPAKAPLDVVVIDHLERPSEN